MTRQPTSTAKRFRVGAALAVAVSAFVLAIEGAHAAGTPAGTDVVNVASLTFTHEGSVRTIASNRSAFRVDEIIDVTVSPLTELVAVGPGDQGRVLAYRVTNSGNGQEAFALAGNTVIGGDQFDAELVRLAFDSNGDGHYDPLIDQAYVPGAGDPDLAPDQSVTIFIISNVPATAADGAKAFEALSATARTGSGQPGTVFPGAGTAGADAVVGLTRASASAQAALIASSAVPELVKAQAIAGPAGESAAVPGAIITYTLTARYSGTLAATSARISDPIPAGTSYVAGSLSLNGTTLTDAAGDDAGEASVAGIAVQLGSLGSGTVNTVRFQVRVNAN